MVIMQNSEYRRHFVPKFESFKEEYTENVGYRSARRSREFAHNRDVFTWEPENWEKKSCTSVLQEEVRLGVNPSFQYKHALHNKKYQEEQLSHCLQEQCRINGPSNGAQASHEPQTPPPSPQNEEASAAPTASAPAQPAKEVNGNSVQDKQKTTTAKKPKKPRTAKSVAAPTVVISKKTNVRPKTCQSGPATARAVTLRPPFVMFGGLDREVQMGMKRTHNVKSPTDVYPSAVRASKWRQEQRAKRPKSAPAGGKKRPVLFDVVMDRETSCWQTEYGGHFVQYKPDEYKRNDNSRMSVRRCNDF